MKKLNFNKTHLLIGASFMMLSSNSFAFSDDGANALIYTQSNPEYQCTVEELDVYITSTTASMFMRDKLMTADEFIAKEAAEHPDNCTGLFTNLSVVEDYNKVLDYISNLSMPDVSLDGMGTAASELIGRMIALAGESVCNAATKEAAKEIINEVMSREYGFDLDDASSFSAKDYATGVAKDNARSSLESKGINSGWIDKDNHERLMNSNVVDLKDDAVDEMFEK